MIFKNEYPRENGSTDFMDSARLSGLLCVFHPSPLNWFLTDYVSHDGICLRCPEGSAAETNPNNFSRDQMIPLISGLYAKEYTDRIWSIFYAHAKRAFFCQNIDRDLPGSTKYPWPHSYIDDRGEKVFKVFDYRDLLLPHDIAMLIVAARIYWLYIFIPIGWVSLLLALAFNYFSKDAEQNQIICICKVLGFVRLYKWMTPDWKERTHKYWGGWRDEPLMAHLIIGGLE